MTKYPRKATQGEKDLFRPMAVGLRCITAGTVLHRAWSLVTGARCSCLLHGINHEAENAERSWALNLNAYPPGTHVPPVWFHLLEILQSLKT